MVNRDKKAREFIESIGLGSLRELAFSLYEFIESTDNMPHYRDGAYCNLRDGEETIESRFCDSIKASLTPPIRSK